jgi:hypothetical protein
MSSVAVRVIASSPRPRPWRNFTPPTSTVPVGTFFHFTGLIG